MTNLFFANFFSSFAMIDFGCLYLKCEITNYTFILIVDETSTVIISYYDV